MTETRLERLRRLQILDTRADPRLDLITARALALFPGATIAATSLVDDDRQWFKARIGLDAPQTSRSVSFCAHAILGTRALVVEDAERDGRFADNSLVTEAPGIRFYAGVPLADAVGALCVIHTSPLKAERAQVKELSHLARLIDDHFKLHAALLALRDCEAVGERWRRQVN